MNPCEWRYAGEGGKHALFSSRDDGGGDASSSSGDGTGESKDQIMARNFDDGRRLSLLRVDKEYLRQSASHHGPVIADDEVNDSDLTTTTTTTTTTMAGSHQKQQQKQNDELPYFVQPYFSHYLDLPQPMPLSWSFLHQLWTSTLRARPCPIPQSRQASWQPETKKDSHTQQHPAMGWLLWDYRQSTCMARRQDDLYSSRNNNNNRNQNGIGIGIAHNGWCISVEFKPKAGYLPSTPLVDPNHRAKYMQSRFVLLQELDRVGYGQEIQRGWKSSPHLHQHQHQHDHEDHDNHHQPGNESTKRDRRSHTSNYDPLDLFSGNNPIRVQRALQSLWECPQNNFKLWLTPPVTAPHKNCDHHDTNPSMYPEPVLVVADDQYFAVEAGATKTRRELLDQFVATILTRTDAVLLPDKDNDIRAISSKERTPQSIMNNLLTCVLLAEQAFLQKLRQWQRLDVLDGDGAVLVYQRLVELCGGSHTQAQRLLDEAYPIQPAFDASSSRCNNEDDATPRMHPHAVVLTLCFPDSPLAFPAERACCPAFVALCQEIHRFSCALQNLRPDERIPKDDTHHRQTSSVMIELFLQQEHETSRHYCLHQIARMESKEACCYLLQNWLLSLVFCDVSFFVTLQQVPPTMGCLVEPMGSSTQNSVAEETCPSRNLTTRVLRPQSEDASGLLELQFHDDVMQEATQAPDQTAGVNHTIAFQYQVKLIDCDKKPSKKLQSRHKKEKVFRHLNKAKNV